MPPTLTFRTALRYWLKLGFISFGGPAGQIAMMHAELVERRRWISERRFLHALNYCMVLPGPEAQQLATYIGWLLHGVRGGIAAGALFVLPSLGILIALSWIYMAFGQVPAVAGVLWGIKPAVTAIVLHAAWRIGKRTLTHPALWAIALASFVAIAVVALPFPLIILGAAAVGGLGGRLRPGWFGAAPAHATPALEPAGADQSPASALEVARSPRRVPILRTAAVGVGMWLLAIGLLHAAFGAVGLLVQMAWFFSKAALLTFGGAYAVLPYVAQAAVQQYGWLTAPQMIDGLALGETTPGPLIMVVAFVAFVGGWTHPVAGVAPAAAAVAAAVVVTFFTFLPSFVFILVGGPVVEATRGDLKFTAPLVAITAAVVGVILNLALFFAWHVLWPLGRDGPFEWGALAIGLAAAVALIRYGAGVVKVILVCAALGLIRTLVL